MFRIDRGKVGRTLRECGGVVAFTGGTDHRARRKPAWHDQVRCGRDRVSLSGLAQMASPARAGLHGVPGQLEFQRLAVDG